jgi:hypothetical protein
MLLAHNAIAVIFAALLALVFRKRLAGAMIAFALTLGATYEVRAVNEAWHAGWWLLVKRPADCFDDYLFAGIAWRNPDELGTVGLLTIFVSPFVFAYYTTWQWTSDPPAAERRLKFGQWRLSRLLEIITATSVSLAVFSWTTSGFVPVTPTILAGLTLAVRPVRWYRDIRARRSLQRRLHVLRKRICGTHKACDTGISAPLLRPRYMVRA